MKALSIKQPYAGLIIAGIKNVENRSLAPKDVPGPIAIVSTATADSAKWWQPMRDRCKKLGVEFPEALCKVNGAVLGIVIFDYMVWRAENGSTETSHPTIEQDVVEAWWNPDMIGFIFEKPRQLLTPIPLKGQLGLYTLPPAVEAEIKKQLSERQGSS